jgi:putative flippase GtrA
VGFGFGALLNYLLHGIWTFGIGWGAFSARRLALYGIVLTVVLSVRIASVAFLSSLIGDPRGYELAILMAATGLSFSVNYVLSKYVVFRAGYQSEHPPRSIGLK